MPATKTSSDVRFGCDNCGHDNIMSIPTRHVIEDWLPEDSSEGFRPSSYARSNGSDYHVLVCEFCGLPRLRVFWWKDKEAEPVNAGVSNG